MLIMINNLYNTWMSYEYNSYCKLAIIYSVFTTKEELDWAYMHRTSLVNMTADELYETSPFFEYVDDIYNPPHIRFATSKIKKCKRVNKKSDE